MVIKFTTRFIHDHAALRRAVKTHLYNIALALICSLTFCNAQPVCFLYDCALELMFIVLRGIAFPHSYKILEGDDRVYISLFASVSGWSILPRICETLSQEHPSQ